jgi:hypothetical protein
MNAGRVRARSWRCTRLGKTAASWSSVSSKRPRRSPWAVVVSSLRRGAWGRWQVDKEDMGARPGRRSGMPDNGHGLSEDEQQVAALLKESSAPLDAIAIASQTRLQVQEVLAILDTLVERGLASKAEPEPVHERFATAV